MENKDEDRKSQLPHSKIFEFWKDKCIGENGEVFLEGEVDYLKSIPVVSDWGEPECWCCGRSWEKIYRNANYEKFIGQEELDKIWDMKEVKSKLNRCHIIAKQLGGGYEASNIFLMCESCHKESPDTDNPKSFFRYVYKSRKSKAMISGIDINKIMREVIEECEQQGKDLTSINCKNISTHIGTHGFKVVDSSIVYAIVDTAKNKDE